eukprot:5854277-Amphidinium_carterae.1
MTMFLGSRLEARVLLKLLRHVVVVLIRKSGTCTWKRHPACRHLREGDVDATRYVVSCRKKRFHRKFGRRHVRRGGLRGTQSTLPSVQEE